MNIHSCHAFIGDCGHCLFSSAKAVGPIQLFIYQCSQFIHRTNNYEGPKEQLQYRLLMYVLNAHFVRVIFVCCIQMTAAQKSHTIIVAQI